MGRKLTYEEVKEVFETKGNKLLSTAYEGNKVKLKYICDWGKPDWKTINNFRNGQRCKECGDKKTRESSRLSKNEVEQLFEQNGCILIGEYYNSETPVKYICNCGNESQIRVGNFKLGTRCKMCGRKKNIENKQKNNRYDLQYIALFENEEYEVLSEYKGAKIHMKLKCPKGHEIEMKPANFKTGHRCKECSPSKKRTIEEVKGFFKNEDYILIDNTYKNAFEKMKCVCPKGHRIEISWDNFRAGKRCLFCNESKGEKKISKYLEKYNFNFSPQYSFPDCKNNKPLRFDFAIIENNQVIGLIEFDGIQHFEPVAIFGGEKVFREQQKKDKIKNTYCKKNKFLLIRIPYWDFDRIEEILDKELTSLKISTPKK